MAKKKEKGKKKKDSAGPREAVRGAVESTFQRASGGASRAQELLDDVAGTLKHLRDANLVETLESVRDEVQSLARRVAALEIRSSEEPAKPARRPAVRRAAASTARKPAARKPAARKPAAAKSASSTTARKPAARKPAAAKSTSGTTARKPAARKPAARKPATPRKPSS